MSSDIALNFAKLTDKGVVQPLQKWPHISGQQNTFRQTLNKPK
jgi:hypothetical protein